MSSLLLPPPALPPVPTTPCRTPALSRGGVGTGKGSVPWERTQAPGHGSAEPALLRAGGCQAQVAQAEFPASSQALQSPSGSCSRVSALKPRSL